MSNPEDVYPRAVAHAVWAHESGTDLPYCLGEIARLRTERDEALARVAVLMQALKDIPARLLEAANVSPGFTRAECWGVERDLVPALNLTIIPLLQSVPAAARALLTRLERAERVGEAVKEELPVLEDLADQAIKMNLQAMKNVKPGTTAAIACQRLRVALTAWQESKNG